MLTWLKNSYNSLRASIVRRYRIKEIVKTLRTAHAQELVNTPGEQWPVVRERQAKEILAVRDGKIDIVNRRSWQYPYLPESLHRIQQPIIKNLPYSVRRFARTPVPRRAINLIKNSIIGLEWGIVHKDGDEAQLDDDTRQRIKAAKKCFEHPNNQESFQSFVEAGIDDMCINGAFVIEPQLTPNPERPFKLWNVDSSTIRIYATWTESRLDLPRYAQMTGLKGERGIILFYDDELIYMKDNPTVDSPFGLGKMEVAFQSVNAFVGVQEMSGRAGADQIHKTWLWWEQAQAPHNMDIIRRHIVNDIEGQAKLSLVAGMQLPKTVEVTPVTVEDLLIPWQEMLIRMIGNAFDMSAMALNLERDVNRSTGEVLDDKDFRSSVLPIAVKVAEGFTRYILHKRLGWYDLEFKWLNLDDPDAVTKMQINQQLYAVNATTPNEIRKSMGKPPLNTKFADLTQIEVVLLSTEATSTMQDKSAEKSFNRQTEYMEQNPPEPPVGGNTGGKGNSTQAAASLSVKPPSVPRVSAPKVASIKAPTIKKLPMAGCAYNAKQVAAMSVGELTSAVASGKVAPDKKFLAKQMETQEPGILQQLSEGLKQYFKEIEDNADESRDDDKDLKPTPKQKKEQLKRFKENKHKPSEIEQQQSYVGRTDKNTDPALQRPKFGKGGEVARETGSTKRPGRLSK